MTKNCLSNAKLHYLKLWLPNFDFSRTYENFASFAKMAKILTKTAIFSKVLRNKKYGTQSFR